MKKQINSNGATKKDLKYEVLDTVDLDLWGAINAFIITPFISFVVQSIIDKSEGSLKFLSPFQTSGKVLYTAIAYQLCKDPLPSLLWGWNYLAVRSYFGNTANKMSPLLLKAKVILLESNDKSIMSHEKTNEINTLYGTYLESSNTNSTKGFYIMIQGADDANRALEIGSYLTNILIKKGYDLIKISAELDHTYSMAKIYELAQKYEPTSKLEGLIINAHGIHIEHNTSVIESYFDTSFLREEASYTHDFIFQSKEGEITIKNGTIKSDGERLILNTETVLTDFHKYFKPYISNNFEFLLSSCKSSVLRLERILEIIPELKCYYTGTSKIDENMDMHPRYLDMNFIKHFLLNEERECPVVDYYHQFYQQFDQQFYELSSSSTDKYSQTYFHASDEITVVE